MKAQKFREMSVSDLEQELLGLTREQFNLRMQRSVSSVVKPHLFNRVRRDIARIKTILNEKQVGSES